jgi:hypothetical protein
MQSFVRPRALPRGLSATLAFPDSARRCLSLAVLALLVLLVPACSAQPPATQVAAYSFDFSTWTNKSAALDKDLRALQAEARDSELPPRLREIAERQREVNAQLAISVPPPSWRPRQQKINALLLAYDTGLEELVESLAARPPQLALSTLIETLTRLRQRVTACYALSAACA